MCWSSTVKFRSKSATLTLVFNFQRVKFSWKNNLSVWLQTTFHRLSYFSDTNLKIKVLRKSSPVFTFSSIFEMAFGNLFFWTTKKSKNGKKFKINEPVASAPTSSEFLDMWYFSQSTCPTWNGSFSRPSSASAKKQKYITLPKNIRRGRGGHKEEEPHFQTPKPSFFAGVTV